MTRTPESNRSRKTLRTPVARLRTVVIGRPQQGLRKQAISTAGSVYLSPTTVDFYPFNDHYLNCLRASDLETTTHFYVYFTRLLHMKLRKRRLAQHVVDDIVQETFLRAFKKVHANDVRDAACLGAYVHGICKNVLNEHYRDQKRNEPMNGEGFDVADEAIDLDRVVQIEEIKIQVRKVLARMSERDREILQAIFLDERDKDEICREHVVDRDYLRVLLHRALKLFRERYEKH
jgi:RNA polymerase sigma-70 factor (ECF subfamily)